MGWTPNVPAHIRLVIRHCLEKDPKRRLRDIGDARLELEEPAGTPGPRGSKAWLGWAALAAVLAVGGAAGWLRTAPGSAAPADLTVSLVPASGTTLRPVGSLSSAPEISPDGKFVLFMAGNSLYLRALDSLETHVLPGAQQVFNSRFWSADSKSVAFESARGWVKVRVPDGAPEPIAGLPAGNRGGSWNDRGMMLVSSRFRLFLIPAPGVKPMELPAPPLEAWFYPEFLPGSEDFLSLVRRPDLDEGEVYLTTILNGQAVNPVLLLKNDTAARYTPAFGGRILFVRDDKLYAQKLNRKARRLEGSPELIVAGVASGPGLQVARADFSVSRTGVVAWRPGKAGLSQVTAFDRQGKVLGTSGPPSPVISIALSPDESRLLAYDDRTWLLEAGQAARSGLGGDWLWFL